MTPVINRKECPVYIKRLALRKGTENQPELRYEDAPAPTINAWSVRRSNTAAEPAANQQRETTQPVATPGPSNKEEFPELQSRYRQQPRNKKRETEDNENEFETVNQFENLSHEFKKLNSLVNLEKMLLLIVKLNKKLETAKTNLDNS